MPSIHLVDETFVVASPRALRTVCDERRWSGWFPALSLTCTQDRGDLGKRWAVRGELTGTGEVWLEAYGDGVIVHVYLRVDWTRDTGPPRRAAALLRRRYALPLKRHLFALKDALECDRRPGEPRSVPARRVVSGARRATRMRRPSGARADDQ